MAIHAPIIAATACAPGNALTFAPSRRDLMRALAPIALATVPAAAAVASPPAAHGADTAEWDMAFAAYCAARERAAHFSNNVFGPVQDEMFRRSPYPKMDFTVAARSGQSATYQPSPVDFDEWAEVPAFRPHVLAIREAYEAHIRDRAKAIAALNYQPLEDEKERLEDLWFEAEAVLFKVPAPHASALATKILLAVQSDYEVSDFHRNILRADATRLGGLA